MPPAAMHIRFRAVRLGEIIASETCSEAEQVSPPTLAEAGIDRKLSSQAQRMAAMPLDQFEARLKRHDAEALSGAPKVSANLLRVDSEEAGRASRRDRAAEFSAQTSELSPLGKLATCSATEQVGAEEA